jgi:hypothetical protein
MANSAPAKGRASGSQATKDENVRALIERMVEKRFGPPAERQR